MIPHPTGHDTTVIEPKRTGGSWWWSCACGDEGGPHETWERAESASIEHERQAIAAEARYQADRQEWARIDRDGLQTVDDYQRQMARGDGA